MRGWFGGVVVGSVGLVLVAGSAAAGDERDGNYGDTGCDPKGCETIEVRSLDEYERLLQDLRDPDRIDEWPGLEPDATPQLWQGTSSVILLPERGDPLDRGMVFTTKAGSVWTERWVVEDPESLMPSEQVLTLIPGGPKFEEGIKTFVPASDYRMMTFNFEYLCPPNPTAIQALPTVVPGFVTDVYRFDVYATGSSGVEVQVGALYRERIQVQVWVPPGEPQPVLPVSWQDTWALWGPYTLPTPSTSTFHRLRLEPVVWNGGTVRAFLQEYQVVMLDRCVVRTRAEVVPLPTP